MRSTLLTLLPIFLLTFFSTLSAQSPGNALDFDGSNDLVNCTLPSVFDSIGTQDITVEAWIYPTQATFSRIMYAQQSGSEFFNFATSSGNRIYFYVNTGGTTYSVVTTNSYPLGQWTHVACRWTAATQTVEVFYNGVLQAGGGGGGSTSGTNGIMTIGSRPGGAQYFDGRIDEMRIWREARSDCEISGNFNAEFSGPVPNLVAYYDFNEGVAGGANAAVTMLPDQSAFNNNGTLANFALNGGTSNWIASTAGISVLGPILGGVQTSVSDSVCSGVTYTFPDGSTQTITSTTVQTSNLTAANLCDSIIVTTVSVLSSPVVNVSDSVCVGAMYTFPDGSTQTITTTTVQTSNLTGANLCDSTIITTVSVLATSVVNVSDSVCPGTVYTFPDNSTQTITSGPVVYTSLLTSSQGCDSTVVSTIDVLPTYNNQEQDTICAGDSYTFPDGNSLFVISGPFTYTSALSSAQGCDSTIITVLEVNAVDTAVTNSGMALTATASNASFQWLDCNNGFAPIANATNATFSPLVTGDYAVEVTQNGCTDTSACHFVNTVGLAEGLELDVRAYPVPAENELRIEAAELLEGRLELMDLQGRVLMERPLDGKLTVLELGSLAQGIYLLRVRGEERSKTLRIEKR